MQRPNSVGGWPRQRAQRLERGETGSANLHGQSHAAGEHRTQQDQSFTPCFLRPEAESLEEELQLVEAKARNKNQLAKVLLAVCPIHARLMPPHPVWQPNGESSRVNWKSLRQACS